MKPDYDRIPDMLMCGMKGAQIARELGVCRSVVVRQIRKRGLQSKQPRTRAILDAIADGHVSSRAIADATNVSVHVVSARLNQLAAEGVVERTGKIKHGLRGMAYMFKVSSP